jgi:hypothetical protein
MVSFSDLAGWNKAYPARVVAKWEGRIGNQAIESGFYCDCEQNIQPYPLHRDFFHINITYFYEKEMIK